MNDMKAVNKTKLKAVGTVLPSNLNDFLNQIGEVTKALHGQKLKKFEILSVLIELLESSDLDYTRIKTKEDLKKHFTEHIRRKKNG